MERFHRSAAKDPLRSTHSGVMIRLVQNSDTSDGRNLMPEPTQNADPAVTAEQSES